ncbi:hypothetical protein ACOLZ1_002889 [Vibrio fluvialis]
MSNQVYLAFYRGRKEVTNIKTAMFRFLDWLTRTSTKGEFSHVEIAINYGDLGYDCYSSSNRDGGVRCKTIDVTTENWVLVPIDADALQIHNYYNSTKHQKYDLLGAIASTVPFVQVKNKQFCSEWCFNAIKQGSKAGWRFSPNDLYEMFK